MLEQDAARMIPGSKDVPPNLSVIAYQDQFTNAVKQLASMRYTDKEVQRLIRTQGQLFTLGQDRIGEMPTFVREKVVSLSQQVSEIYLEIARGSRAGRSQRDQTQTI